MAEPSMADYRTGLLELGALGVVWEVLGKILRVAPSESKGPCPPLPFFSVLGVKPHTCQASTLPPSYTSTSQVLHQVFLLQKLPYWHIQLIQQNWLSMADWLDETCSRETG